MVSQRFAPINAAARTMTAYAVTNCRFCSERGRIGGKGGAGGKGGNGGKGEKGELRQWWERAKNVVTAWKVAISGEWKKWLKILFL